MVYLLEPSTAGFVVPAILATYFHICNSHLP